MKKLFLILLLLQISASFGQNQTEDPSSKKIIGTWYMDKNRSIRWVFTQDGKIYNYNKNTLQVMFKYIFSDSCKNNSDDTTEFISVRDRDGDEFCFRINTINENKNGILSLTKMDNMETLVFVNDINVKTGN